ncbi:MAG: endolytic transglycosylase MltG [Lachnospiraceae bacterium]|nr:endolytic transglycosylase MltG [Lachnospiraceae bacterium]
MDVKQLFSTLISALIKIAVAIWLINLVYQKTMDAYDFGYRVFTEAPVSPAPGRDIVVTITEGKGYKDIAEILYEKGLVRDKYLAFVQILASEHREGMEPGVYTLNTSMTTEEMCAAMDPEDEEEEEE